MMSGTVKEEIAALAGGLTREQQDRLARILAISWGLVGAGMVYLMEDEALTSGTVLRDRGVAADLLNKAAERSLRITIGGFPPVSPLFLAMVRGEELE